MIRVLLVDDHAAFRQPLAFMLQREADVEVVGQAGTLAEARRHLQRSDVAVVDLNLPDGNGVELVRDLREANPQGRVMVLTASVSRKEEAQAVEAGAATVVRKSASITEIIDTIRRLSAGEELMSLSDTVELLRLATRQREQDREAQAALARLTARERDVLQELAKGLGDKEIASALVVSPDTVRTHMVNILAKLGVDSRLQAVIFAIRHGAVSID